MPLHEMSDGTSIYYEDFGEGTPVIFTSSGNATHAMWDAQVADLATTHRTVTYDWRGTGKSDKPRAGYTAEHAVSDLVTLVSEVIQRPAVAVGHGMGGHIALLAAKEHPSLISGLGIASSGPWYCGERDGIAGGMSMEFINSTSSSDSAAYPDLLANMTDTYLFHSQVSNDVRMATIMQQLEWPMYVLDRYDEDMIPLDHREYLNEIQQPTVIIHGRHDTKQRFSGTSVLDREIPNSNLVIFEESAHSPQAEETKKFNETIRSLLTQVSP